MSSVHALVVTEVVLFSELLTLSTIIAVDNAFFLVYSITVHDVLPVINENIRTCECENSSQTCRKDFPKIQSCVTTLRNVSNIFALMTCEYYINGF